MGSRPDSRSPLGRRHQWGKGACPLPSPGSLMRLRPHDHLFAAAGVAAALSLMGAGAAALQGSVLGFHEWPLVAGEHGSGLKLPDPPAATPQQHTSAGVAERALRDVLLTAG